MATVGCKLPHGLIAEHKGVTVTLNGLNSSRIIGGFGLTEVDDAFAKGWFEAEKNTAIVKNGVVFLVDSEAKAKGAAAELDKQKSGFEALDQSKPVAGVVKAEE